MTVSGCSTKPSIKLITPPKIDTKILKALPSADIMEGCEKLLPYNSTDEREVVTITIKNYNKYYLCASKLKSAILFIENS